MSSRNPGFAPRAEFHLFRKLPIELRQEIWFLSLPPRVVEVLWCERTKGDAQRTEGFRAENPSDDIQFFSYTPLPAALIVCHDSRDFVLPFYPICFASKTSDPQVRFNFSLDTLYFARDDDRVTTGMKELIELMCYMNPVERPRLERLALPSYLSFEVSSSLTLDMHWDTVGECFLDEFTALKEMQIVTDASISLDDTPWYV